MRRLVASLAVLAVLVLGTPATAWAQEDDGSPSIIPDPDDEGTSNGVGFAVVGVLVVVWLAGGAVLLVRARRRGGGTRPDPVDQR